MLRRLANTDHARLILARRLQARGPHTEGFQIPDTQDVGRDDGSNQGHISNKSASQAGPDIQTFEAGTTSQLAGFASHSTRIGTMGTSTVSSGHKTGTQLLNEHQQRGHIVQYEGYLCIGHTEHNPLYGCRVWVDGRLEGTSNDKCRKKDAKEEAAFEAAKSLLLTERASAPMILVSPI